MMLQGVNLVRPVVVGPSRVLVPSWQPGLTLWVCNHDVRFHAMSFGLDPDAAHSDALREPGNGTPAWRSLRLGAYSADPRALRQVLGLWGAKKLASPWR
jgi:hypothetical protein